MSINDQYWARILPDDPNLPMLSVVISQGRRVQTNLHARSVVAILSEIGWDISEVTTRDAVKMTNGEDYITVEKVQDTSAQLAILFHDVPEETTSRDMWEEPHIGGGE